MPTTKTVDLVDYLFLGFIMTVVIMDTLIIAYIVASGIKTDPVMVPVFSAFITSTAVAPLSAWAGYRYGSSKGSQAKDDTIAAQAVAKAGP